VRQLARLAAPVVATQLGTMMLGVVDALMVGRLGKEALAAASLGNVWVIGTMLVGMGLVLGMDPLVSQAHGARDRRRLGLAAQQGLAVALVVSLPTMLALAFTREGLLLLGQRPALAEMAHGYAVRQVPGVPAFLAFIALRQYLQNRGIVTPAMWVAVAANGVNAAANWLLIFGNWGLPALGVNGSALATSLTRIFMVFALALWIRGRRLHEGAWIPWTREALRPRALVEVVRFGLPVAVQFGLEVWAFQFSTLMAGRLGAAALAAHAIVLNMASVSFMVPLGISIGTAARVGNLIGENRPAAAQRSAWIAMGMAATAMALSALLFVALRDALPRLYTPEVAVLGLGAGLLPIAAAFQLFDGLQVVGNGVLRGMGRTVPAAVFNLVGFYLLALPAGWFLTFRAGLGVAGVWWGLCIGLGTVAILLVGWIAVRGPSHVDARVVG
jgi:MATE family multidrug resistance protein